MNNLIYIIKNKLFKISKEANKIKRPSYVELIKYQDFNRTDDNKLALGFVLEEVVQIGFQNYLIVTQTGLVLVKDLQIMRLFIDM